MYDSRIRRRCKCTSSSYEVGSQYAAKCVQYIDLNWLLSIVLCHYLTTLFEYQFKYKTEDAFMLEICNCFFSAGYIKIWFINIHIYRCVCVCVCVYTGVSSYVTKLYIVSENSL
jgi:hypothetical protein